VTISFSRINLLHGGILLQTRCLDVHLLDTNPLHSMQHIPQSDKTLFAFSEIFRTSKKFRIKFLDLTRSIFLHNALFLRNPINVDFYFI
jgi:hypothetical protein